MDIETDKTTMPTMPIHKSHLEQQKVMVKAQNRILQEYSSYFNGVVDRLAPPIEEEEEKDVDDEVLINDPIAMAKKLNRNIKDLAQTIQEFGKELNTFLQTKPPDGGSK